jgi:hypothetical protein
MGVYLAGNGSWSAWDGFDNRRAVREVPEPATLLLASGGAGVLVG